MDKGDENLYLIYYGLIFFKFGKPRIAEVMGTVLRAAVEVLTL